MNITCARQGHRTREWHFHGNCKGGRRMEPEPMAGGEERLELVHMPGECANCDALR